MIGTTLSHYRVLELLGRGGMGEVYAAEDLKLRRRVALKVLPPEMAADPERRHRFEREARAIASLNHPGIVTIYSVEHEQGISFLTMELVEGRTLDQCMPKEGMPVADFLKIAIPLAEAINAAHERGILHRDLKPSNVMLTKDGRIKVLDFGLAKLTEPSTEIAQTMLRSPVTTSVGQIMGTVSYMAPEQAEGKDVDQRADIFGVGVLLYELASGVRPFVGDTNVTILIGLLRDTPRPVTELRADFSADVASIIQRCLEKDPAQRYQSASDLRVDLEAIRGTARRRLKVPRWAYAAGLAAAILAGLAVWRPTMPASTAPAPQPAEETHVLITGDRMAVLDFENRTGDPELNSFSRMLSEAIVTSAASRGVMVVGAADASANDGVTIAGGYYLEGAEVRVDARLMSASRGVVVKVIEPVRGPRASLAFAVDEAQRRIMDAVVDTLPARPAAQ
jgi:predicted Ser/Thr protein kinase/TolB-like protein